MQSVTHASLPNGVRLVHIARRHLHRAVVGVFVDVGSRHETSRSNGIAHFLEHMLFRGTRRLSSAQALHDEIEGLGATLTAATHCDYTRFEMSGPVDAADDMTQLLGEMVRRPAFSRIDVERAIVREEILEDLDDDHADCNIDNLSRRQVFGSHPLGMRITGSLENLERFSTASLRAFMRRHYRASSLVVSVCSPESPIRAFAAASRAFRGVTPGSGAHSERFVVDQSRARIFTRSAAGAQTALRIAFPTPGTDSPLATAVDLLVRVLDDGMSTRLHRRICDELGLVYGLNANVEMFRDVGVFEIGSTAAHSNAPLVVHETLEVLAALVESGIDHRELDRARRRALFDLESMNDDASALSDLHGAAALPSGLGDLHVRRAKIENVTRDDIRRASRVVFSPSRLNLLAIGDATPARRREFALAARRFRERLSRNRVVVPLSGLQRVAIAPIAARVRPFAALDARIARP